MKNVIKVLGIIALAAIIGFGLTACPSPEPEHVHQWGDWSVTTAATCTTEGSKTRTCALDPSHTETEAVPVDPTAHNYLYVEGSGTVPTCTADGHGNEACSYNASHTRSDVVIPKDPTAHDWEQLAGTAPTCTTTESGSRKCKICETAETLSVIPALGHNWEWVETTAPTYTKEGVETKTCKHDTSHTDGTSPISRIPFTTSDEFIAWLDSQPANTVATTYNVKANVGIGMSVLTSKQKYVGFDFSDSTMSSPSFRNYSYLTGIILPNTVTSIGNYAFSRCTSLASVTFAAPSKVTSIGDYAFSNTKLSSVTIPASVTSIGRYAFSSSSLTSVTFATGSKIPDENFGENAFPGNSSGNYDTDQLKGAYSTGQAGTYTWNSDVLNWVKQ